MEFMCYKGYVIGFLMLGFLWFMDLGLNVFKVIVIRWLGLESIIIIKANAQGYKG